MSHYVLGFLFDIRNENLVCLIEKTHPQWQAGRLNGIGGHIEGLESASEAMQRECAEEIGIQVPSWEEVAHIVGRDYLVHCFTARTDLRRVFAQTDEKPIIISIHELNIKSSASVVDHVRWLVPMCRIGESQFWPYVVMPK